MDETPEGFEVRCIPHGPVGVRGNYLEAFALGLQHDYDSGGGCL
jgi:hypothetical protein